MRDRPGTRGAGLPDRQCRPLSEEPPHNATSTGSSGRLQPGSARGHPLPPGPPTTPARDPPARERQHGSTCDVQLLLQALHVERARLLDEVQELHRVSHPEEDVLQVGDQARHGEAGRGEGLLAAETEDPELLPDGRPGRPEPALGTQGRSFQWDTSGTPPNPTEARLGKGVHSKL